MPVPEIVDLDPASDARFRDVYGRHHNRMISRNGNLILTRYHTVSGTQANVNAAEIVSLDASENAQYDLILRNSSAPISTANLTNANVSTWSASSILSLRQGTTSIRSANVTVGNLSVSGTLNVTGASTQNVVNANALSALLTTGNNAVLREGTHIGYNTQIGGGTSDFMNKCASATGGFKFYRSTGSGTASEYSTNTLLAQLDATGFNVAGDISANGGSGAGNFGRVSGLNRLVDATTLQQGAHMSWNYSLGSGETNFVNKSGSGSGGFVFYNSTGNGTAFSDGRTALLSMTSTAFSLASTMRRTYTPTVTAGTNVSYTASSATGYYMDFGAIKIVWGTATFTWTTTSGTSGECNVTLPSSFLGTLTLANFSVHKIQGGNNQYVFGGSTTHTTSNIYFFFNHNGGNSGTGQTVGFFVVGH